jgi:hypothetical protein
MACLAVRSRLSGLVFFPVEEWKTGCDKCAGLSFLGTSEMPNFATSSANLTNPNQKSS